MPYSDHQPDSDRGALNDKLGSYASGGIPEGFAFEDMPALQPKPGFFGRYWPLGLGALLLVGLTYCLGLNETEGASPIVAEATPTVVQQSANSTNNDTASGEPTTIDNNRNLTTPSGAASSSPSSVLNTNNNGHSFTSEAASSSGPIDLRSNSEIEIFTTRDFVEDVSSPGNSPGLPLSSSPAKDLALPRVPGEVEQTSLISQEETPTQIQSASRRIDALELPVAVTSQRSDLPLAEVAPQPKEPISFTKFTSQHRWVTEFNGGLLQHNLSDNRLGGVAEFNLGRRIGTHFILSSGVGRMDLRSQHGFSSEVETKVFQPGTVDTIFRSGDRIVAQTTTDSVPGIRRVNFHHTDHYTTYYLPVRLDYERQAGNFNYGLGVGLAHHFTTSSTVRRVNPEGQDRTATGLNPSAWSYSLRLGGGYQISSQLGFRINVQYGGFLSEWDGEEGGLNPRVVTYGATAGLRYYW
ncbi:hypothetical protein [Lewinella sp. 4G2]|uniref:hypothetical protein n=1 Tax=Lewinella sp. 4G2 TaxID=1803372 RepID=UPI0007B4D98B|nr:hypothetical protein [Lewinella sp. 4G2]OAV44571.1 hypothetical protein A3850_008740 [Lewinella sp. 4G2]